MYFLKLKKRYPMKGETFFTGSGPILILTTYDAYDDSKLIERSSVNLYELSELD